MSKEIYKEYVNKWIDEDDRLKKCEINDLYLFCGQSIRANAKEDLLAIGRDFYRVTRKPKTQMINGHEVVAPRYDDDYLIKNNIWVFNPLSIGGVANLIVKTNNLGRVEKFGWFDNERDALAYANAHRENKND